LPTPGANGFRSSLFGEGGVDVLVANVGANKPAFFLETPEESWTRLVEPNPLSCMTCARAALPAMLEQQRGAIVAIASTAGPGEPRSARARSGRTLRR
jgi:short-subunit dehydrogenase